MNNRKLGDDFEREFCDILSENGFWVLCVPQTANGQPFDVLAVKNGKAYAIDCKVCSTDRFAFSRIEDNQYHAMKWWEQCGNQCGWFALKFPGGVYMLPTNWIEQIEQRGQKHVTSEMISCFPMQWWVSAK